jgi:cardiolipin synthase A/B
LHTKMMVIDGCWATVGSTNLDNRSMALNDELNVVFYDQSIARRLEDIFNDDLTHAKKISAEQLEQRGWISRVLGFLTSPVLDYF